MIIVFIYTATIHREVFSLGIAAAARLPRRRNAWERRRNERFFLFRPAILRASTSTYFNMYMIRWESIS